MSKATHDKTMAEAKALDADSPKDTVRRVLDELRDEIVSLEEVVATQLQRVGVRTSDPQDNEDVYLADDDELDSTEEAYRAQFLGPTAEELAAGIARGEIRPDDERVEGASRLATKLSEVTLEVARLEQLLM